MGMTRVPALPISGTTRLVGVIGWPVAHSLSPRMHNAAFAALGLDWAYVPLPVVPGRLPAALDGLAALGFAGANVTVPHKSAILSLVQHVTEAAGAIGASNTLVVRADGSLSADNTDAYGFLADLRAQGVVHNSGEALVLGAGGAARAVTFALCSTGMRVAVANRTLAKAQQLCQTIEAALPGAQVSYQRYPDALPSLVDRAQLIVNATSLGLDPDLDQPPWHPDARLRSGQTVYDLIPGRSTSLLRLAAAAGARAIGGLGMLVHQGARAFELWTGLPAPIEIMAAAAGFNRPAED